MLRTHVTRPQAVEGADRERLHEREGGPSGAGVCLRVHQGM